MPHALHNPLKMKQESELKTGNTQTHTCCPKCGCVHVGDCKFKLKDRPTPPVQAKTAEEILNKICGDWMPCKVDGKIVPAYLHDDVIKCMEAYHAQLKPQLTEKVNYSKEIESSMSDEEIIIVNMLAEKEPSCYADIASIMIEYAAWQQQKQAETISRLRESLENFLSLEDLIRYCGEIKEEHLGEAQAINNAFRVAKEALKEKES